MRKYIVALVAFYPPASEWITQNMTIVTSAWAVINVILRIVTKDKISLSEKCLLNLPWRTQPLWMYCPESCDTV